MANCFLRCAKIHFVIPFVFYEIGFLLNPLIPPNLPLKKGEVLRIKSLSNTIYGHARRERFKTATPPNPLLQEEGIHEIIFKT